MRNVYHKLRSTPLHETVILLQVGSHRLDRSCHMSALLPTSSCSNASLTATFILEETLSIVGVILCTAAIALTLALKLYKQLIYRLALYLVADALAFGITCIFSTLIQIATIKVNTAKPMRHSVTYSMHTCTHMQNFAYTDQYASKYHETLV